MKKIVSIFLLAFVAVSLMARPAYPGKRTFTQPDGSTITLYLHGDEWGHWFTDASGRVMEMAEDGFYREKAGVTPEMAAQAASIRRQARQQQIKASASGHVAQGKKNFLVILVQFKDKKFTTSNPQTEITNMLNQKGYSKNGATGSARDFYYDSSNGYFEPTFDVYGPATLDNNMSYYGANDWSGNDQNAEQAVVDGCKALDSQIDFSKYDLDGDGKVDMVFMLYAGYGEADTEGMEDTIWPHMYYLSYAGKSFKLDGKTIDKYACANEVAGFGVLEGKLDGIGAVCHEFGHAMGLPDFYDTDGTSSNGNTGAMYDFSTMDAGNYNNYSRTPPFFNMVERIILGWSTEADFLELPAGEVTIPAYRPDNGTPLAYRTNTDANGEFFVYECHGSQSWDSGLSGYGLLVYHVDQSSSHTISISDYGSVKASQLWNDWESYNGINKNGKHPCCYVVASSDPSDYDVTAYHSEYGGYYYVEDGELLVFPGSKKVTSYTAKSWSGKESDYKLSNISYSSQSQSVTLKVTLPVEETALEYPVIANPGNGVYTAGSTFTFALEESTARPSTSVVWYFDGTKQTAATKTLTAGKHTIEAEVTVQSGKKNKITLEIQVQ